MCCDVVVCDFVMFACVDSLVSLIEFILDLCLTYVMLRLCSLMAVCSSCVAYEFVLVCSCVCSWVSIDLIPLGC